MVNTETMPPRDIAVSLFVQGKSAAEVWSSLVSSGMQPAEAETLVRELVELRQAQMERQREDEEHVGSGFCKTCYAESTWQSPGNISTFNGIGTTIYGRSRLCYVCGSVVGVRWVVFGDCPLFPLGTYRYRILSGDAHCDTTATFVARRTLFALIPFTQRTQFIARRTRTSLIQIAIHYAVPVLCFVLLVNICYAVPEFETLGPALMGAVAQVWLWLRWR